MAETERWNNLPKVQAKCKALWMQVLISDAALEKLCLSSSGDFMHDPIAVTVACLTKPETYSQAEHPVWKAAFAAAQAQLTFTRYMERSAKRHDLNMFSIRRTCDVLVPPSQ